MVGPNEAFEQLADSNPVAVVPVPRPSAAEFVSDLTSDSVRLKPKLARTSQYKPGPLIALAAFLAIVVVGLVIALNTSGETDVVDTVPPPSTLPVPSTTAALSPALLIADKAASAWSEGDFSAVQGLMADGTSFGWSRSSDFAMGPVPWTDAELRARIEIDAALRTTIELSDCVEFSADRISCAILRTDDLVRAQGIEPAPDVRWRLTVEDGLIVEWVSLTPDLSNYFLRAREPFHEWLDDAHPEIESPYVANRGAPWRADTDFASVAAELVAEYAESLGGSNPSP